MRKKLLGAAAHLNPAAGAEPVRPNAEFMHDPLLKPRAAAAEVGLCPAAFWRAVSLGRLPRPVYPMPRAPRWRRSELLAALSVTRALPAEAKAARISMKDASGAKR